MAKLNTAYIESLSKTKAPAKRSFYDILSSASPIADQTPEAQPMDDPKVTQGLQADAPADHDTESPDVYTQHSSDLERHYAQHNAERAEAEKSMRMREGLAGLLNASSRNADYFMKQQTNPAAEQARMEQARAPYNRLLQNQKENDDQFEALQSYDPNSERSQQARSVTSGLGMDVPDDYSYATVKGFDLPGKAASATMFGKKLDWQKARAAETDAGKAAKNEQTERFHADAMHNASAGRQIALKKLELMAAGANIPLDASELDEMYLTPQEKNALLSARSGGNAPLVGEILKRDAERQAAQFGKANEDLAGQQGQIAKAQELLGEQRDAQGHIVGLGGSLGNRIGAISTGFAPVDIAAANAADLFNSPKEQENLQKFESLLTEIRHTNYGGSQTAGELQNMAKLSGQRLLADPALKEKFLQLYIKANEGLRANRLANPFKAKGKPKAKVPAGFTEE